MRPFLFVCSVTLTFCATAPAQYGFLAHTSGSSTQINSGCGFDCTDPQNVVQVTVVGGDRLNYEIQGDGGALAGVLISIVPPLPACPGIPFAGIQNSLLLDPNPTFTAVAGILPSLSTSTAQSSCGAFGRRRILALFDLPAFLSGLTVSFQGFVYENGTPTFTRALQIDVT